MRWMFITAEPAVAAFVEACGIDRVFVDLEVRGKRERQGHLDTHVVEHGPDVVPVVAAALQRAELLVRINPLDETSEAEIELVLAGGARRLMLPMFRTAGDVSWFLELVSDRVPVTLLVETPEALAALPEFLPLLRADDQIHFGLNDLAIAFGMSFLFEPLARGMIEQPAQCCREAGVPFGIGGIGRVGQGDVPAEWILGELVRHGADWVILSRAFRGHSDSLAELNSNLDLAQELERLIDVDNYYRDVPAMLLEQNCKRFRARVAEVAARAGRND